MERPTPNPNEKPVIDRELLAAQVETLNQEIDRKQRKLHAARRQVRAALVLAGNNFSESTQRELTRFAEPPELLKIPSSRNYEAERKATLLNTIAKVIPSEGRISINQSEYHDLDMAGGYWVYHNWTLQAFGDVALIQTARKEDGYTYSRSVFDTTNTTTLIIAESLQQPLIFEGPIDRIPTNDSKFDLSQFRFGSWASADGHLYRMKEKFEADQIAEQCDRLLSGCEFMPGKWSGTQVRSISAEAPNGTGTWRLAHVVHDEAPNYDEMILQHSIDDTVKRSFRLQLGEGTFDAYPDRNSKEVFETNLALITALLSQTE